MIVRNPLKSEQFAFDSGVQSLFVQASTDKGVLLLHSYTSNPLEFKELAQFLIKKGFTVYAPLLPGHGTHPDDLIGKTLEDWHRSVEQAYDYLAKRVRRVYVVGNSFGGNLAIHLAAQRHPALVGLISLGTPVRVRWQRLSKFLIALMHRVKKYHVVHFRDQQLVAQLKSKGIYPLMPLKSLQQFFSGLDLTVQKLARVTVPALVVQSSRDRVTDPRSAEWIYQHLGTEKKELLWVDGTTHALVVHDKRRLLYQAILRFLNA